MIPCRKALGNSHHVPYEEDIQTFGFCIQRLARTCLSFSRPSPFYVDPVRLSMAKHYEQNYGAILS